MFSRTPDASDPKPSQLSNGYGLLYELVSKQADLNKALMLHDAGDETRDLIEQIAQSSRVATEKLELFARADPGLTLGNTGLPRIDTNARNAEESSQTWRLLFSEGVFELRLLLTQVSATSYGANLADELESLDPDPERRAWLLRFAEEYRAFHERVEFRLALKETISKQ